MENTRVAVFILVRWDEDSIDHPAVSPVLRRPLGGGLQKLGPDIRAVSPVCECPHQKRSTSRNENSWSRWTVGDDEHVLAGYLLPRETKTEGATDRDQQGCRVGRILGRLRLRAGSVERVGWGGIGMSDIFRDRLRPAATRTDGWDGNQYSSGISESETPSERPPGSNSRSSRSATRSDAAGRLCSSATTETARVAGVTVPWAPPRYLENRSTGVPRTRPLRNTSHPVR